MNQSILSPFGNTAEERVLNAINAFKNGTGVLVLDDEDRENEGDLIFPAETITPEQMAKLIRYGSGIVCLCITDERCQQLNLPPMVEHNNSVNKTAFTVTIEAAKVFLQAYLPQTESQPFKRLLLIMQFQQIYIVPVMSFHFVQQMVAYLLVADTLKLPLI